MSVPTWKRQESKMKFLSETYNLSVEVTEFIVRSPVKYRTGTGDELQRFLVRAMHNGRLANSIFINSKSELIERRYHLLQMKAAIDTVATFICILLDVQRRVDGISRSEIDKLNNRERRIGEKCNFINKCIIGLIESDITRWNKAHPCDKVAKRWRARTIEGDIRFNDDTIQVHHVPETDDLDELYKETY